MERLMGVLAALLTAAVLYVGSAVAYTTYHTKPTNSTAATVLVEVGGGHGSGVHIGGGYVITAAHVPEHAGSLTVSFDDGKRFPAEVVGFDKTHDLALLHINGQGPAAEISCAPVKIGQYIQIVGNPLDIKFIHTYGRVGGLTQELDHWAEVFTGNIVAGPGNSGGPVFDTRGRVVGILVGGYPRISGISFIVPSTTICRLMGRA